ncbi:MAG: hypothetical protein K5739_10235, partial [Lachnospiraceae bacterium]|nr:hypothetical protein [Lachnospiraceae bacterium]
ELGSISASSVNVETNGSGNASLGGMKINKKLAVVINGSGNTSVSGKARPLLMKMAMYIRFRMILPKEICLRILHLQMKRAAVNTASPS